MPNPPARERFFSLLRDAVEHGTLVKLTLGKYRGIDPSLKNVFVRPVTLKAGPQLSFVYRHATRDVTKNHPPAEALSLFDQLIGRDFLDAHLFTPAQTAQLACEPDGGDAKVSIKTASVAPTPTTTTHDRPRAHALAADAPWLKALGVTNDRGQPREAMAAKFRQINKFVELLGHLAGEADLPNDRGLIVYDMGCGKGYLTFATSAHFGARAEVIGVESRIELVELCNRVAREQAFKHLRFAAGSIEQTPVSAADILIALHACDTATDDAIAKGISAGARLIVVSPCCQKELRPQLVAPPALDCALKHGIFRERQAEFVTDALRAALLEWAGYRTKVFEFVSTEHTAKNLMIAATRARPPGDRVAAERLRELARFYGIKTQRLASHLKAEL